MLKEILLSFLREELAKFRAANPEEKIHWEMSVDMVGLLGTEVKDLEFEGLSVYILDFDRTDYVSLVATKLLVTTGT